MDPDWFPAKSRAGISAYVQGDYAEAARCFAEMLAAMPGHPAARINLANAYWALKDYPAAALHAEIALGNDPGSVEAWMITGAVRLDRGEAGAVEAYAAAVAPGDAHARFTLGCAKLQQRRAAAALVIFDALIAAEPGHARARHNRANALIDLNRLAEAGTELHACLGVDPGLKEAWATLGYLLTIEGALPAAIAACDRAIALDADFAVGQWNRGVALLLNGDFAAGFAAYEWRKRHPVLRHCFTPLPAPPWQGEALLGRHLLVRAEQGFGDTIMLARFLPKLTAAARVTLCCPERLFPLFQHMDVTLLALDAPMPAADYAVDQMSLPHVLRLTEASIPDAAGYLRADAARRIRLPEGPCVGLVWAGNAAHDNDARRSLPVGALAPLITLGGLNFVGLQIGARQGEYPIYDAAGGIRDYGDTAAVISQLNAVVTVDTSVAHLAGALGVACHVLLSAACDWRWRLGREDTAWYKSLKLHRQQRLDDWSGPIAGVVAALRRIG
jgi:tetratricopeptide (TPR) repeat protein